MSRWRVISLHQPTLTAVLGHPCPGAHSPVTVKISCHRLPGNDLGEKPTMRCWFCANALRPPPHLPGPADVEFDLQPGELARWTARQVEEWRRS